MMVLTPQQQEKVFRLQAQASALNAALNRFHEERRDLLARKEELNRQRRPREQAEARRPAVMTRELAEIDAELGAIAERLRFLSEEDERIRPGWKALGRLVRNVEAYIKAPGRAN
jgi:Rad3-related DNA helicase